MKWYEPGLKMLPAFLIVAIIAGASLIMYFLYILLAETIRSMGPYYGTAVIIFLILAIYIFASALFGLDEKDNQKGYY